MAQDPGALKLELREWADSSSGVIGHSPRFVLVDKDAHIRGYYDSRESEVFVRLKNDIDSLLKG